MKNKKGYTLVELIITLAVIGIMIVPIFNSFVESHKVNVISKRRIVSSHLAQSRMEEIKSFDFNTLKFEFQGNPIDTSNSTVEFTDGGKTLTRNNVDYVVTSKLINVTDKLVLSSAAGNPNLGVPNGEITLNVPTSGDHSEMEVNGTTDLPIDSTDVTFEVGIHSALEYYIKVRGTTNIRYFVIDGAEMDLIVNCDFNTDDWNVEFLNLSDVPLRVKIVNDLDSKIEAKPSAAEPSVSDIWISNSMLTNTGNLNVKHWYDIVVEVEQDGTVYEIFESTIGK